MLALIFIMFDFPYSGRSLIRSLESFYPKQEKIQKETQSIILLGGVLSLAETMANGFPVSHKTLGRVLKTLEFAKLYPHLPIIFIGNTVEANFIKSTFEQAGIADGRLNIVDHDKQGFEASAQATTEALRQSSPRLLEMPAALVTSAYNLPRGMHLLKSMGWNVYPITTDFHTAQEDKASFLKRFGVSVIDRMGPLAWTIAMREWAGLWNMYISGQTKTLMPKK